MKEQEEKNLYGTRRLLFYNYDYLFISLLTE